MSNKIVQVLGSVCAAFFLLGSGWVTAQTATFNESTRYLTLPSVTVGVTTYNNVVVRLDSFAVVSVGSVGNAGGIAATCGGGNLTLSKFNAIAIGMSLAQVNQLLGCQYAADYVQRSSFFTAYTWVSLNSGAFIYVYFDPAGNFVQDLGGSFKLSSGI